MPLLKDGKLTDDPWVYVPGNEDLPADGPVIVDLVRWRDNKQDLLQREDAVGVRLKSEQAANEIANDLDDLEVVALDFPAFGDGRSYSNARRLRDRYGYRGELRAVGDVLRDQFLFMKRCGFDALEVADSVTEEDWAEAVAEFSHAYQPATDDTSLTLVRHQQRRRAEAVEETG